MSNLTQARGNQVLREAGGLRILPSLIRIGHTEHNSLLALALVQVPSRRISASMECFFEPDAINQTSLSYDATNITWTLKACAKGVNAGYNRMYDIETNQPLPRDYEVDSAIRFYEFTLILQSPTRSAVRVPGVWYFRVYWEPNLPLDDKELTELFSKCQASLPLVTDT